jgi:hypothetical protein
LLGVNGVTIAPQKLRQFHSIDRLRRAARHVGKQRKHLSAPDQHRR